MMAGIDVKKYGCHSSRGATASKAKAKCVPMDEMRVAGWKRANTLTKFYDLKKVKTPPTFAENVLAYV